MKNPLKFKNKYQSTITLGITPDESTIIKDLIEHLDHIEIFGKMISKHQTLNSSFLIGLFDLKNIFKEENDVKYGSEAIKLFRKRFRDNFDKRIEVKKEHVIAFLLDPQAKNSRLIARLRFKIY